MTRSRPIKVLQVIHALGMGGAETWLMELMRHWSETGAVEGHFLITGGDPAVFDDEAVRLGAQIHYLRYNRRSVAGFVSGFRHLLARQRFDAIHDHADLVSGWHFLMGAGRLPPVRVTHVHNPLMHLKANYAVTRSRRFATAVGRELVERFATHVCGTSSKSLVEYGFDLGLTKPRVLKLHCGFDIDAFNSERAPDRASVLEEFALPPCAKMVLFLGRLDRDLELDHTRNHKNSWLAVLAARAATERDPHVHLLMAGAGDEPRRKIEQRIAAWGLSDRLRLLGMRKDAGRLLRAADILLFPSAEEGLGMVAVEAQAAGTPVLASSAIPAEAIVVPELFHRQGLDRDPGAWADAILRVIDLPRPDPSGLRDRLAASDFSVIRSARKLEAVYGADAVPAGGEPQ